MIKAILIATEDIPTLQFHMEVPSEIIVVASTALSLIRALKRVKMEENLRE
jgi:hypothetical protein